MNTNTTGLALDATDLFNLLMAFPSYPDTTALAQQANLFGADLYRQFPTEVVNPSDLTPLMASEPLSSTLPNSPELPYGANTSAQLSPMATSFNIPASSSPNSLFYPTLSPSLAPELVADTSSPTMAMSMDMLPEALDVASTTAPAKTEAATNASPTAAASPAVATRQPKGKKSVKVTSSPDIDNPSSVERKALKRTASHAVDEIEEEVDLKKLSSKERRQIRNKISARNFRLRRKEYIATLEGQVKELQDETHALEASLGRYQTQNADLKAVLAKVRNAIDAQLATELGLDDPALLVEPGMSARSSRSEIKSTPKTSSASTSNGKPTAHAAKKIKLPSSPTGLATTVMSLFNLSSVLSADKQHRPVDIGLKLPLFSLPRHAETRPSRRCLSDTALAGEQPLAGAVVNPQLLIGSPMEKGALFSDDESMGDGCSTPPTPFASPVLSAAIPSPDTLVGDDELMAEAAYLQSLVSTPFFNTLTTNTPTAQSPTLQAKQLPQTQEELQALEHALEDEFHRTLSLSLNQLANSA